MAPGWNMPLIDERRRRPRFPLLSGVEILLPGRGTAYEGTMANLSRTGMALRIRQPLNPNHKVTVRFCFLSREGREATEALNANVIWQSGKNAGLEFESPLTLGPPDYSGTKLGAYHLIEILERVETLIQGESRLLGMEGGPMKKVPRTGLAVRLVGVILALLVCQAPGAWAAEKNSAETPAAEIGLGASSFVLSVPYGAVKVSTAIVGGVVGGLAYVLSGFDKQVADSVWYTTIGGDYVVTPDHLTGKRALRFTGVPPENHRVTGQKD
jgi:hypothetical protein